MKLYGIPNCDTVKKARAFLESHGVAYDFHDFKKHGVTEAMLANWLQQAHWQKLLKKTGPTWRQLPETVKSGITCDAAALALMLEKPNVIRRPVLEDGGRILALGFTENEYTQALGA